MDDHILISMQIAIVGIVVVVGLFILWRRIARLEERVDTLVSAQPMHAGCGWMGEGEGNGEVTVDANADEIVANGQWASPENIMSAIFDIQLGETEAPKKGEAAQGKVVLVEQVELVDATTNLVACTTDTTADAVDAVLADEVDAAIESESLAANGGLSKTRLRKMPVDVLKEMCLIRGLVSEGTKNILVDRIFDAA